MSDWVLLERVLANFTGNAIRYTDVGRVLVGCRRLGTHLHVMVCHTRIGIDPEHHAAIFDEFYRVSAAQGEAEARHSLGVGLGKVPQALGDLPLD